MFGGFVLSFISMMIVVIILTKDDDSGAGFICSVFLFPAIYGLLYVLCVGVGNIVGF